MGLFFYRDFLGSTVDAASLWSYLLGLAMRFDWLNAALVVLLSGSYLHCSNGAHTQRAHDSRILRQTQGRHRRIRQLGVRHRPHRGGQCRQGAKVP